MEKDDSLEKKLNVDAPVDEVLALSLEEIQKNLSQIEGWGLEEQEGAYKIVKFYNFNDTQAKKEFIPKLMSYFLLRVGKIAESQGGYYPDMIAGIGYGKVKLELPIQKMGDLSRKDFSLAAKIDSEAFRYEPLTMIPSTSPKLED